MVMATISSPPSSLFLIWGGCSRAQKKLVIGNRLVVAERERKLPVGAGLLQRLAGNVLCGTHGMSPGHKATGQGCFAGDGQQGLGQFGWVARLLAVRPPPKQHLLGPAFVVIRNGVIGAMCRLFTQQRNIAFRTYCGAYNIY
jgi:hypothetical protein